MKLDKFKGKYDEDFDLQWEDLRAFFALYKFNEEDKLRLINAHLGGAARRVVQNEDMESISTVEKLHELLRGTFSDKHDWQNILMNIKQYPEEKIKAFAVRLRVAALKCGFKGKILDNMCFNYLRKCSLPHISALLDNCLPGTSFDIALEHAIQFERKKEVEGDKKNSKRKGEAIDQIEYGEEEQSNSSNTTIKKLKQELKNDYGNTFKQIKDQIGGNFKRMEESINNLQTSFTLNKTSNQEYFKAKDGFKRIRACFHCAKPNHSYHECRNATESEKENITNLLKYLFIIASI